MGEELPPIPNNQHPLLACQALFELQRVLKANRTIYMFTNWRHCPFVLHFVKEYTKLAVRHVLVWRKHNFGFGYGFRNQYELILVLEKGKPKYNGKGFSDVQHAEPVAHSQETHPHQKPLRLISNLILHSTHSRDVVLDPFVGSGTTAIACKQLGRNFLGFEINPEYVRLANKRLREEANAA